jgi:hypothetical protein
VELLDSDPALEDLRRRLAPIRSMDETAQRVELQKLLRVMLQEPAAQKAYAEELEAGGDHRSAVQKAGGGPYGTGDHRNRGLQLVALRLGELALANGYQPASLDLAGLIRYARVDPASDSHAHSMVREAVVNAVGWEVFDTHGSEAPLPDVALALRDVSQTIAEKRVQAVMHVRPASSLSAIPAALTEGRRDCVYVIHRAEHRNGPPVTVQVETKTGASYLGDPFRGAKQFDRDFRLDPAGAHCNWTMHQTVALAILADMGLSSSMSTALTTGGRSGDGLGAVLDDALLSAAIGASPVRLSAAKIADWVTSCSDCFEGAVVAGDETQPLPALHLKDVLADEPRRGFFER